MRLFDIVGEDLGFGETAAWQKKSGKNKNGGLNKKGVASYRRQHPGSKLQTAVTTKPSKLKKGSKAAKRRKSFCARMKGMKKAHAGAKTKRDPNSRINKALRKWHCESVTELHDMLMIAESVLNENKNHAYIKKYMPEIAANLGIKELPKIELLDEPMNPSFGTFDANTDTLYLVTAGRHPVDVLRTLAHELVHYKQRIEGRIRPDSGRTGSAEENEANAVAGVIMRDFDVSHPDFLTTK